MSDIAESAPSGGGVAITLPDGSTRRYPGPVTGQQIAADIGPGLAKAALAVKVDGVLRDLMREIPRDARVEIVTRDSEEALDLLRHDCAHVMAEAVQELYPGTPDHLRSGNRRRLLLRFRPQRAVHAGRFREDRGAGCTRSSTATRRSCAKSGTARERGRAFREDRRDPTRPSMSATLPAGEDITIYRQGDWLDLCLGPHLPSTGKLGKAFKLMKLSGAYWRGDPQRTRSCSASTAPAGATRRSSRPTSHRLEEAEKRDHRRLGPRDGPVPHAGGSRRQRSSGTPRAGRSTARSRATCAARWRRPAMSR